MTELLTPQRAEEIFGTAERAARASGCRDVEVIVAVSDEALTRFANSAIHQNVAERVGQASIRVLADGRTARATTNRFDEDSIARATQKAITIARALAPDPDLLPLAEAPAAGGVRRYFETTANCSPLDRARVVSDAIRVIESEGQTAAGIYETARSAEALMNSTGLRQWHTETMAKASITAMAADSSGWAKASSPNRAAFDVPSLARSAALKGRLSANPREIPAGRYTVILEAAAVLDLVGQMFPDFSATALSDQRSFLNDRLGERIFGENITIRDDVDHPSQAGAPFDGEGVPRRPLTLVNRGVPFEIPFSRAAAHKAGVAPTGHGFPLPNEIGEMPLNIVIEGGETGIEEMIASTARGILVTRFWYIREVDPYEKIMTGMTRDGTFLIENGSIVSGIRNFRFNQSLIEMLQNVKMLGPSVRASGEETFDMVVPAMKVCDFHFTEVTRF